MAGFSRNQLKAALQASTSVLMENKHQFGAKIMDQVCGVAGSRIRLLDEDSISTSTAKRSSFRSFFFFSELLNQ
jgi:hypothetical protein